MTNIGDADMCQRLGLVTQKVPRIHNPLRVFDFVGILSAPPASDAVAPQTLSSSASVWNSASTKHHPSFLTA